MALTYENLPDHPLPNHRRYIMGVSFDSPMTIPQVKLQEEGTNQVIMGFSPHGPASGMIQFVDDKNQPMGYMKGSLEGIPMNMSGRGLLQVFDAQNTHIGTVARGMGRSQGIIDPSKKWIMALVGSEAGTLGTMKFHYAIIDPFKKKFFRKLSGKPDPEERIGYLHGSRGQAMSRISLLGLPGIKPGAFGRFQGEFTLDLDRSSNILLALALFFRQNAIFEFKEAMPRR